MLGLGRCVTGRYCVLMMNEPAIQQIEQFRPSLDGKLLCTLLAVLNDREDALARFSVRQIHLRAPEGETLGRPAVNTWHAGRVVTAHDATELTLAHSWNAFQHIVTPCNGGGLRSFGATIVRSHEFLGKPFSASRDGDRPADDFIPGIARCQPIDSLRRCSHRTSFKAAKHLPTLTPSSFFQSIIFLFIPANLISWSNIS